MTPIMGVRSNPELSLWKSAVSHRLKPTDAGSPKHRCGAQCRDECADPDSGISSGSLGAAVR
jgi:hypothetical protein